MTPKLWLLIAALTLIGALALTHQVERIAKPSPHGVLFR